MVRRIAALVLGLVVGIGAPAAAPVAGAKPARVAGPKPARVVGAKPAPVARAGSGSRKPATGATRTAGRAGAGARKPATGAKRAPAGKPTPKSVGRAARAPDPSRFSAPADATAAPAYRYAALSQVDCEAELVRRGISFGREPARGVLAPVRLAGPLQGVLFRTDLADAARATSPWELADCRLVLALDDFAAILKQHDIVEVRHYSMYRPPPRSWPEDRRGARHDGGLALDAARFIGKDGSVLDVDKHFGGAIGARTCGPGAAPRPATPEAVKLRAILCEAVDRRLFNVVLTPNYNRPHKNHFHLEVTEGVAWFLVH